MLSPVDAVQSVLQLTKRFIISALQ